VVDQTGSVIAFTASIRCLSDGPSEYLPNPSPGRACPNTASATHGATLACSIKVRARWRHE